MCIINNNKLYKIEKSTHVYIMHIVYLTNMHKENITEQAIIKQGSAVTKKNILLSIVAENLKIVSLNVRGIHTCQR